MGLLDRLRGKKETKDPVAALREACRGAGEEDSVATIELAVMPTRDRPAEARRALGSLAENVGRDGGRVLPVLLVDDGRAGAAAAGDLGKHVRVLDRAARTAWAERLAAASGVDAALARFALLGELDGVDWPTAGACRNAGMLAGAGKGVLFVDDDIDCRAAQPPDGEPSHGLTLSSAVDPSELYLYGNLDQASDRSTTDVDILGAHEEMLGLMAATCVEALPADDLLELTEARPGLIEAVTTGDAWVRATMLGIHGDSGMASPNYFLTLRGQARDRLLADYPAHRLTRAVARCVPRATLSSGRWLHSAHLALDLRDWAPPFPPAGRNSDGLWVTALKLTRPTDLIGHVPWMVAHRPPEPRSFTDDDLFAVFTRLSAAHQLMLWLVGFQAEVADSEPERQAKLGRDLADAGRLAPEVYRDMVREMHASDCAARAAYLNESLDLYDDEPDDWAADLQKAIGLAGEPPDPDDPAAVQQMLVRYGDLLVAWPQLVAAATLEGQ